MTSSFLILFLLPFIVLLPKIFFTPPETIVYDYFLLVHQWPATFCILNPCDRLPPVEHFTIHGMWPQKNVPPDPSKKFDQTLMNDSALKDMGAYWPNLTSESPDANMYFWEHEWTKHGSSSATVLNQIKYFSTALERYRQLNLTGLLLSSGITPGNSSYKLDNIKAKIIERSKFDPVIRCKNNSADADTSLLFEIRFCISHCGENFMECPFRSKSNCTRDVLLPYP